MSGAMGIPGQAATFLTHYFGRGLRFVGRPQAEALSGVVPPEPPPALAGRPMPILLPLLRPTS